MRIAVVVGRFQPFHDGHKALIDFALTQADQVVVMIGDSGFARDSANPFTIAERRQMIEDTYESSRIHTGFVYDQPEDAHWVQNLARSVETRFEDASEFVLIGHKKDESSFYLDLLGELWELIEPPADVVRKLGTSHVLDATDIRHSLYNGIGAEGVSPLIPDGTLSVLQAIQNANPEWFKPYADEIKRIKEFKDEWDCVAVTTYGGPILAAADALVFAKTDDGYKVLLIERGGYGDGQYALPGGFVEPNERVFRAALRELKEETGLDLDDNFKGITNYPTTVFDNPNRSKRGRIITHVLALLVVGEPEVVGSDDAKRAFWLPLKDLNSQEVRRNFFSDHWHIINTYVPQLLNGEMA